MKQGNRQDSRRRWSMAFAGSAMLAGAAALQAGELLWSTSWSNWTTIESTVWGDPPRNREAADDFDVVGTIEQVIVGGYNSCLGPCPFPPELSGVWVRFYAWTASGPGSLQSETFIAAGDPGFLYSWDGPDTLDITLPEPFEATGLHFLSVQLEFVEGFYWGIWVANHGAATGSHLWVRDNLTGGGWEWYVDGLQNPLDDDLYFSLYGTPPGGIDPRPPVADCGAWSIQQTPNPGNALDARLNAVEVIAPWDVWAVGNYSASVFGNLDTFSLAMHWDGSAWTIFPTPNPSPAEGLTYVELHSVAANGPDDVWAAGGKNDVGSGSYVGTHGVAFHWDGTSWTDADFPQPAGGTGPFQGASGDQVYDIAAIAPDDVWFVGRWFRFLPSDAVIWPGVAMHWDGSDFEVFEPPMVSPASNQFLSAVSASAPDNVWAVGGGNGGGGSVSYIFRFDGEEWSHVPGPTPGTSHTLYDVAALAPDDVWVGGSYSDGSGGHPLMLHWNGSSWTQVATPAAGIFAVHSADNIFTYGIGGLAHWDGSTWSSDPGPDVTPWVVISGLDFVSPCEVWAVGMRPVGGLYATFSGRIEPAGGLGEDADLDGVADTDDNCPYDFNPAQADCDEDGAGDICELLSGTAQDCNGDSTPDDCTVFDDCNANGVPDECEADCQQNGVPDACDIAGGASVDCDANGVPDECDSFDDCNHNGVSDICDVQGGGSEDSNTNQVPDECEALGDGYATVNTVQDVVDFGGAQQLADLPGPDGLVSFREACLAVDNTPGPQTIAFNIPQEQWWLDQTQALLNQENGIFVLDDDFTTLDFTTQTTFTGDTNPSGGEVGIYGLEPNAWGVASIYLNGDHCTVKGMGNVYQRGYAVRITGNYNRVIGSNIAGPWHAAVYITGGFGGEPAIGNLVGGTLPGEGNTLSAGGDGVRIDGPAADNIVVGNRLTGSSSGVSIRAGALGNRVGGPTAAERNIISGAGHYAAEGCPSGEQVGIENSSDNIVEGNYIGTTPDGSASAGQLGTAGVFVLNSTGTVIRNNVISGIVVEGWNHCSGIRYGTAVAVAGNSQGTLVQGNRIGTDVTGTIAIPNRSGIMASWWPGSGGPSGTLIGGLLPGEGNVVAYSELSGVAVAPDVSEVTISGNAIFSNGALGINLTGGGNGSPPVPVITRAMIGEGTIYIEGSLDGQGGQAYRIEFFANQSCDDSGAGEGEMFLGSTEVVTDAGGHGVFVATFQHEVIAGDEVTATAALSTIGNTSEFAVCRAVQSGLVLVDTDQDSVPDMLDNCPLLANLQQEDCDNDGQGDACSLANGSSEDCNANGLPDGCEFGNLLTPSKKLLQTAPAESGPAGMGVWSLRNPCALRQGDINGNCILDDCE